MPITGDAPLSLIKPELEDTIDLSVINGNYDLINDYALATNTAITELDGQLDTAQTDITALDGRLDTAEADIIAIQAAIPSIYTPVVTIVSDTTYSILSTDASDTLRFTSASAVTVTIDDVLPNAGYINCVQDGLGQVSFVAGSGVTIQSLDGFTKISSQYGWASIIRVAANQYRLVGNLSA